MRGALSGAIALLVLTAWLGVVAVVAVFWLWAWPSPGAVIVAVVLTAGCLAIRPRVPRLPAGSIVAGADEFPTLHAVIAELAAAMGSRPPHVVAFVPEFEAFTMRFGFRRRRVIVIGMLLWEFLGDGERRAVVAHELAHDINGDMRRGLLTGTSVDVLTGWVELVHPGPWSTVSRASVVDMMAWAGMRLASLPAELLLDAQLRLVLPKSREAEFRADELAAEIVGSHMIDALDKLRFESSVEFALDTALRSGARPLIAAGRRRFDDLTDDELEVLRASELHRCHSADATHPATSARIDRLAATGLLASMGTAETLEWQRVDHEIEPIKAEVEAHLEATMAPRILG